MNPQGKGVNFLLQVGYDGLGMDFPEKYPRFTRAVSREDVLGVPRKYLRPENSILVGVANQKVEAIE